MTRMLLAAMSGWGKSWYAQAIIETNIEGSDHDAVIVLDFKDEYRGLCTVGFASHFIVGERETAVGAGEWQRELAGEEAIVLTRVEDLPPEEWQEIVRNVAMAARRLEDDVLVVIDEAHFVAPNQSAIPDEIKGLATTGRGEGASSLWVTQRLTELNTTVISQCNARVLGGFSDSNDRDRFERSVEYPPEVHIPGGRPVGPLPDEITAGGEAISVRKWEDDGVPVGSEWIYSDETGEMDRLDTRDVAMESIHHGAADTDIDLPR